ncbi:MAPEG family protein [Dongia rigui]|uniref:MAPEG family protein n=1 Tax=Dongia rigui TaxID=940149 RepID=A0ABU5E115_9PROT|nr:MAPEG family protein [Dongia rigui]MDY0873250.1 MAPEG family protein [Dongia rigui]
MPMELPTELSLLVWSVILCLVQMVVSAVTLQTQVGLPTLAGNREGMPTALGLAGRAQRAHRNMLENLPLFAALVLIVQVTGHSAPMTVLGAQLFFWARLAYAVIYLVGIPWLRTASWAVSMVGIVLLIVELI